MRIPGPGTRARASVHPLVGRGLARGAGGHTLIEMMIACCFMVVIFAAGLAISVESRDSWSQIYTDTGAQYGAREALRRLAIELAASSAGCVSITTGTDHDTLTFRAPVSLNAGEITWGAEGVEDHAIRISVTEGRLVRQVVDENGAAVGRARILTDRVDGLHGGAKGFRVTRSGALCTITLRIRAEQDGHVWRKEFTTAVLLRN